MELNFSPLRISSDIIELDGIVHLISAPVNELASERVILTLRYLMKPVIILRICSLRYKSPEILLELYTLVQGHIRLT